MKKPPVLFAPLFFLLLSFVSCDKNGPSSPLPVSNYGYLKMKLNGSSYKDTANAIINKVENIITISSTVPSPPSSYERIIIKVNGSTTGTYLSNSAQTLSQIKYIKNGVEYLSTHSTAGGSISIQSIDTVTWKISGTFSGIVSDGNGNSIILSEGSFNEINYWEPAGGGGSPSIVKNMNTEVNGQSYTPDAVFTAAREGRITISSNKNYSGLSIQMPLSPPGTYPITSSSAGFSGRYANKGSSYQATSGQITITSHDFINNILIGTFYFTTNNGDQVTNGSFSVVY